MIKQNNYTTSQINLSARTVSTRKHCIYEKTKVRLLLWPRAGKLKTLLCNSCVNHVITQVWSWKQKYHCNQGKLWVNFKTKMRPLHL